MPVKLFIAYSHVDELMKQELVKHLSSLSRSGIVQEWHDRRIEPGADWNWDIDRHLNHSDIILLLISADFIHSDYCYGVEMKRALERHECSEARVIPVILRPCDWHALPFGTIQAVPKDGKAVTTWSNQDEAYTDIARGVRAIIGGHPKEFSPRTRAAPPPTTASVLRERPAPPPTAPTVAQFTAEPTFIQRGQTSTLRWEVNGSATSVSINQGVGTLQSTGSNCVSPSDSTTYTLTATGPGGSTTASATVNVSAPPPAAPTVAQFTAEPTSIQRGQTSTLHWEVTGSATSVSINQGLGTLQSTGSKRVSPSDSTTYTLTTTGPGGSSTASATVNVSAPPPPPAGNHYH